MAALSAAANSSPPYAALALSLTVQEWSQLGIDGATKPTSDMNVMVDRCASLLLIRLVAVATNPKDASTTGICRNALLKQVERWPPPITTEVIEQCVLFTRNTLMMYEDVPYHNAQHATHVVMSTSHIIDQMLLSNKKSRNNSKRSSLFGLRHDPIALLALVFAALVHDVKHTGIPNRQLSAEDDELAILYNDQSIAEQHSLHVGFQELLKPQYQNLREIISQSRGGEGYRPFRRHVISLVLNTDIASPERTQLFKSKWKEAFPHPQILPDNNVPGDNGGGAAANTRIRFSSDELSFAEEETDDDEEGGSMLEYVRSIKGTTDNCAPAPSNEQSDGSDDDSFARPTGGYRVVGGGSMIEHVRRIPARSASLPAASNRRSELLRSTSHRQRLGIRRSMDLSGESIVAFSTHNPREFLSSDDEDDDDDDCDELKASVVMECILTACDVGHNLQGWGQMCVFSHRLYQELLRAYSQKRGPDPAENWFENQMGFLQSYLLPLAHRLEETGLFNVSFSRIVKNILDQWLEEGQEFTENMIRDNNA